MHNKRIGVILFQLGGPDTPEAIEPFLYNLFCDPDIIDFPMAKVARPVLAKLISKGRARKVRHHYGEIGGASPIRRLTEQQAVALERELRKTIDARVFVAMRYWHPFTSEAIEQARAAGCDELVLLPLYPHYSSTTTGSSFNEWERCRKKLACELPTKRVREYFDYQPYVDCLAEQIEQTLERFPRSAEPHLVFSAHNVPASVIEAGDPYKRQIEATARLVVERGGWPNPVSVCYQSKVGSQKWLHPSLHETIERLGQRNGKAMLVVPIAFVSDHVETLSEINIEAREEAAKHGIEHFEMMPGLNDSPSFIRALASLVMLAAEGETERAVMAEARAAGL